LSGLIPWESRQAIGTARAFWETVIVFTLHPRKVVRELTAQNFTVSASAARAFRRRVLLIIWVPLVLVVFGLFATAEQDRLHQMRLSRWYRPTTSPAVFAAQHAFEARQALWPVIGLLPALFAACEVITFFFRCRGGQPEPRRRASTAISYYTAAPLALLLPAYLLACGVQMAWAPNRLQSLLYGWSPGSLCLVAIASFIVLRWWAVCVALSGDATSCAPLRKAITAAAIPLATVGLIYVCCFVVLRGIEALVFLSVNAR
jgi:hypothetical protein